MKKIVSLMIAVVFFSINAATVYAQDPATTATTEQTTPDTTKSAAEPEKTTTPAAAPADEPEEVGMHQLLKSKFIEGDPAWMTPVLLCLILGLAIAIERIISLSLASININRFGAKVEDILKSQGIEAAKEYCRKTRGPVASVYYQGLARVGEGMDVVEKSIASYGSVQMGQLERGLVWLSLFIALAPMLGFLGTVVGMIFAFDQIAAAGDISPTVVAGGIKVALLTTVGGLIVAIILQIFYNYIVSKVDTIVNNMEESAINLLDMLINNNVISDKK